MKHDFKFDNSHLDEVRVTCCNGDWTYVGREHPKQAEYLKAAMEEHRKPWVQIDCIPIYARLR